MYIKKGKFALLPDDPRFKWIQKKNTCYLGQFRPLPVISNSIFWLTPFYFTQQKEKLIGCCTSPDLKNRY